MRQFKNTAVKILNKNIISVNLKLYMDLVIMVLVISLLISDFFSIIFSMMDSIFGLSLSNYISSNLSEDINNVNIPSFSTKTLNTNVQLIKDDCPWFDSIKKIIIYGAGFLRFQFWFFKGWTPTNKGLVIASTIAAESLTSVILKTINEPNSIKLQFASWKTILKSNNNVDVLVEAGNTNSIIKAGTEALTSQETSQNLYQKVSQAFCEASTNDNSNKFLPDVSGLEELTDKLLHSTMEFFRPILAPVKVDFSNEILANQIYDLSILLFILSIIIYIILISLIVNVVILINSDKLINYFTNKYIKWYINLNKKLIGIEVFFLSGSLLYFMYYLSYGLHYIATHPINFS